MIYVCIVRNAYQYTILINNVRCNDRCTKKSFFIVATVWMIFLGGISNFGIEFGGNNFILNGWIYFYYAGWYIVQENEDFSRKKFYAQLQQHI